MLEAYHGERLILNTSHKNEHNLTLCGAGQANKVIPPFFYLKKDPLMAAYVGTFSICELNYNTFDFNRIIKTARVI